MSLPVHTPAVARGTGSDPLPPRAASRRSWSTRAPPGLIGCLLLLLSPSAAPQAQEGIGRLFSSPAERIELDRLRDDFDSAKGPKPADATTGPVPDPVSGHGTPARAVRLDGIVLRGGVPRVSWVNGEMAGVENAPAEGVRIDADDVSGGQVRIRLPDGRSAVRLKPGQEIAAARGRVLEAYERRPSKSVAPVSGNRAAHTGAGGLPAGGEAREDATRLTLSVPARPGTSGAPPSALVRSDAADGVSSMPVSERFVAADAVPRALLSPLALPASLVRDLLRKAQDGSALRAAASSGKPAADGG